MGFLTGTNYDVLRLRLLLMILCASAIPCSPSGCCKSDSQARLRALAPEKDEQSWPRLMGKSIFALFGGNYPAIWDLRIGSEHDQDPDDFIECWATCYWCIQACLVAPLFQPGLEQYLNRLLDDVCRLTLRTEEKLVGEKVIKHMEGISALHEGRLGIAPQAVVSRYRRFVSGIFSRTDVTLG